nr:salivary protein 32kD [Phlebotomus papatasi]
MSGHILTVGLNVVMAHCATLSSSASTIPIQSQGKDFPVPFVSEQTDDFYDDKFYPDISDDNINEVVRDNGRKGGDRGSKSTPSGKESHPSATQTGGRRPSQSPCGESRPSGSATSGRRPSQSPRGESLPPATLAGRQNSRQQDRRQNKKQSDLSKYKNSSARYIFTTGNVDSGKTPDEERIFRTNRAEYVLATGGPYDNYLVEIIDGPNPSDIGLKQSTTMGGDSKLILDNPNRNTIVGRIKTFKA